MAEFEIRYDPAKALANLRKHGVTFDEGATAMRDRLAIVREDPKPHREQRFLLIGESETERTLIVCFAIEDDDAVRIISARRATSAERRRYMNEQNIIRDSRSDEDDMLPEYGDLEGWRRNPNRFIQLAAIVTLQPDVHNVFRNSEQVNEALRMLIREGRVPQPSRHD